MIGQLTLLELRDKPKKALGKRYADRSFHNAVLAAGNVPLTILEQEVNRYIEEVRR